MRNTETSTLDPETKILLVNTIIDESLRDKETSSKLCQHTPLNKISKSIEDNLRYAIENLLFSDSGPIPDTPEGCKALLMERMESRVRLIYIS